MRVDLHFHSKFSDGGYWPNQLVEIACKHGLNMVALTDHDTFEGVPDFIEATKKKNLIGIPGIEINFVDNEFGFQSELLGYFPNGNFENTYLFIKYYQDLRRKVAEAALEKASKLYNNHGLSVEELVRNKIGSSYTNLLLHKISLTRRDIYSYLNEKRVDHNFIDFNDFKKKFFMEEEFMRLSTYPELRKCIEVINSDGGYAVLAHPAYQFNKQMNGISELKNQYKENLIKVKDIGLWGIEMHSYEGKEEADGLNKIFYDFAKDCNLNVTYGSDFHSHNVKSWRELGCINGQFMGFI